MSQKIKIAIKPNLSFISQLSKVSRQPCDDVNNVRAIDFQNILVAFLILPIGAAVATVIMFAEKIRKHLASRK